MHNIAIFPGTFDPITLGHINLVERAQKLFDKVIVAVAKSDKKTPLFTLDERVHFAQNALQNLENVAVLGFDCLLYQFANQQGASIILRGVRSVTDFEYELQSACINRIFDSKLESIFLTPAQKYFQVSSSLVRELISFADDISAFVPPIVIQHLKAK